MSDSSIIEKQSRLYSAALGITVVDAIGLGIVLPLIPFLILHFGGNAALVTQALALYSLAGLFGGPWIGRLSDNWGFGRVVIITLIASVVATAGILISWSLAGVFFFRAFAGFLTGRAAAVRVSVTHDAPPPVQARRIAGLATANIIGVAVGPMVAGVIGMAGLAGVELYRATLIFGISISALAAAAGAATYPWNAERNGPADSSRPMHRTGTRELVRLLHHPYGLALLTNWAQGIPLSVTALTVHWKFGWGAAQTGWLLGGMTIAIAVARFALYPRLLKAMGIRRLITLAFGVAIVPLLMAGFTNDPAIFVIALCVFTSAIGIAMVIPPTLVALNSPPPARGAAQGISQSFATTGMFLSASVNGLLFAYVAPQAPFVAGAIVIVGGLLYHMVTAPKPAMARA